MQNGLVAGLVAAALVASASVGILSMTDASGGLERSSDAANDTVRVDDGPVPGGAPSAGGLLDLVGGAEALDLSEDRPAAAAATGATAGAALTTSGSPAADASDEVPEPAHMESLWVGGQAEAGAEYGAATAAEGGDVTVQEAEELQKLLASYGAEPPSGGCGDDCPPPPPPPPCDDVCKLQKQVLDTLAGLQKAVDDAAAQVQRLVNGLVEHLPGEAQKLVQQAKDEKAKAEALAHGYADPLVAEAEKKKAEAEKLAHGVAGNATAYASQAVNDTGAFVDKHAGWALDEADEQAGAVQGWASSLAGCTPLGTSISAMDQTFDCANGVARQAREHAQAEAGEAKREAEEARDDAYELQDNLTKPLLAEADKAIAGAYGQANATKAAALGAVGNTSETIADGVATLEEQAGCEPVSSPAPKDKVAELTSCGGDVLVIVGNLTGDAVELLDGATGCEGQGEAKAYLTCAGETLEGGVDGLEREVDAAQQLTEKLVGAASEHVEDWAEFLGLPCAVNCMVAFTQAPPAADPVA